jgi:aminoglycoside N3'-acetyltransferase
MDAMRIRSRDALVRDLRVLGVAAGDVLMVHASLRRLGPVEGRAEGVVLGLDDAAGPAGTVMMVLGASNPWDWVNQRPEEEREELLAGAEPFDCLTTPALGEVGVLAEELRRMPGTVVSDHPEGRFAARGRLAEDLTRDVPWDDYYGPGSPLARFVAAGGKVLRLAADPETVTVLHYAEYLANVPGKRRVRRHRRVKTASGTSVRVVDSLDDEHGIADYESPDYFGVILREYLASGAARQGRVGSAASELIDAKDLTSFATRWLECHLGPGTTTG